MNIQWTKYKTVIILCLIILIICLWLFYRHQSNLKKTITLEKTSAVFSNSDSRTSKQNTEGSRSMKDQNTEAKEFIVDIKGAVVHPGIYHVRPDDRVIDGITLAGGLTKKADRNKVNLAQKVADEMVIYVPVKGEEGVNSLSNPMGSEGGERPVQDGVEKVNINTADEQKMQDLPGIGPAKAKAIILYREENGPFKSLDDLTNVSGIGDKSLEKIKPAATLN
ncbi:helix-hairpin-helix domain-containing protein [Sporolactobacillus kofuensis]|uniref:Helix-hairpin-helix domain-containing protein n=1 Tax=Sporolactobacillus kofuensis TaxID=269672 RepID=A0ABW1WCL7_9BACL|nr:helix-hairpin-helix domain-containing protein [Sporolactobacillus kofuensis]MCO7175661.1 helix-hairpin-helix domain-containing protein [Sporolactobacillus kofuensis]